MLARVRRLAGTDSARRDSWVRAYRWARDRASDHVVHVEDEQLPLFPLGSLAAAAALDDEAFAAFMSWLCLARAQYLAFL
eukprot:SAG31_NODE_339_length_17487_cov_20.764435_17_plen_80_part_00